MPVECYDALTKFAVNRFVWHRRKCRQIKNDIDRRDYGPSKIVSDWLDCWCTTIDDWCKTMKRAHGQVETIVFRVEPSFDDVIEQPLPVLVMPGAQFFFTEVVEATVPPDGGPLPPVRHLTRRNFHAKLDPETGTVMVRLEGPKVPAAALMQKGTYQTYLLVEELDSEAALLAIVLVEVRGHNQTLHR